MAIYKYFSDLLQSSEANTFDDVYAPSAAAPFSGIYKCVVCGREDVSAHHHPLPPRDHHQHSYNQAPIRWRLAVWADRRPT